MNQSPIECVKEFLDQDQIRYNPVDENAVELYMQAKNLTMHLIIYQHNGHLIFRVPGFIRNVELKRLDVLLLMMKIMNEILDIRFEISADGKSLSACVQHIVEDSTVTRAQFDLSMMIIMHIVDDAYPQFLQLLYANSDGNEEFAPVTQAPAANLVQTNSDENDVELEEELDEEVDEKQKKNGLKIN